MLRILPVLALTLVFAAPAVAEARIVSVSDVLGNQIERVAPRTDVPIRLPGRIDLGYDGRVYGEGIGSRRDYDFDISGDPSCNHATACFFAHFSGERGSELFFPRRVRLAGGRIGRYKPIGCGASCSPPAIEWRQGGYVYRIQWKVDAGGRAARRALIRKANQSIRSTPL